jgi:hypothetical protein
MPDTWRQCRMLSSGLLPPSLRTGNETTTRSEQPFEEESTPSCEFVELDDPYYDDESNSSNDKKCRRLADDDDALILKNDDENHETVIL